MDADSAMTDLFYLYPAQVSHIPSHWLRASSWFSFLSLPRFLGLHGDKSDRRGAESLSKTLRKCWENCRGTQTDGGIMAEWEAKQDDVFQCHWNVCGDVNSCVVAPFCNKDIFSMNFFRLNPSTYFSSQHSYWSVWKEGRPLTDLDLDVSTRGHHPQAQYCFSVMQTTKKVTSLLLLLTLDPPTG